jgi:DNA-binding transcriptional LysR family regulator
MNVQDLRYLSVAADALNLTHAAGALGLHASTISIPDPIVISKG